MDTMTSRYPDADLQASLRHLRRFLRVGAVALVLTGLSLSFATDPAGGAPVPSDRSLAGERRRCRPGS